MLGVPQIHRFSDSSEQVYGAFSNTAIDMIGPVQIKLSRKTLKEPQMIIFTCTTSHAIHLELVTEKNLRLILNGLLRGSIIVWRFGQF